MTQNPEAEVHINKQVNYTRSNKKLLIKRKQLAELIYAVITPPLYV